jgi:hypothetical protein
MAKISDINKFSGFLDNISKVEKYAKYQGTFSASKESWIGILYDGDFDISDVIISDFNSAVNYLGVTRVWALDTKSYPKLLDLLSDFLCTISQDYEPELKKKKVVIVYRDGTMSINTYNPFIGQGVDVLENRIASHVEDSAKSNIKNGKKMAMTPKTKKYLIAAGIIFGLAYCSGKTSKEEMDCLYNVRNSMKCDWNDSACHKFKNDAEAACKP